MGRTVLVKLALSDPSVALALAVLLALPTVTALPVALGDAETEGDSEAVALLVAVPAILALLLTEDEGTPVPELDAGGVTEAVAVVAADDEGATEELPLTEPVLDDVMLPGAELDGVTLPVMDDVTLPVTDDVAVILSLAPPPPGGGLSVVLAVRLAPVLEAVAVLLRVPSDGRGVFVMLALAEPPAAAAVGEGDTLALAGEGETEAVTLLVAVMVPLALGLRPSCNMRDTESSTALPLSLSSSTCMSRAIIAPMSEPSAALETTETVAADTAATREATSK